MAEGALIVSGFAIVIAAFGIWMQWKMYQASGTQLTNAATVLAKIEGQTELLQTAYNQQFNTMLNAFVTLPDRAATAGSGAEEASSELGEVLQKLRALEEATGEGDIASIRADIGALTHRMASTQSQMDSIASSLRPTRPSRRYVLTQDQQELENFLESVPGAIVHRYLDGSFRVEVAAKHFVVVYSPPGPSERLLDLPGRTLIPLVEVADWQSEPKEKGNNHWVVGPKRLRSFLEDFPQHEGVIREPS